VRPALANPPPAWVFEGALVITPRHMRTLRRFHSGVVGVIGEDALRLRKTFIKYFTPSGLRAYSTLVKAPIYSPQAQEKQ
jgi:hypothetical protein